MKHQFKQKRASSNDALIDWLKQNTKSGSLLDLGCGPKLYSDALRDRCDPVLTVDAWAWVDPDIVADLETTPLSEITDQRWDYVLMLDFIEHLDKSAGQRLIDQVKQIVNRRIFLLTPMEAIWTDNTHHVKDSTLWCHGNEYDVHKSLWTPADFADWTRVTVGKLHDYFVGYYEA
jgi:predicted TPR repeat methyltransferase